CLLEQPMEMMPGSRGQPSRLAIPPTAHGPFVERGLNRGRRKLAQRNPAEGRDQIPPHKLAVALMRLRRDLLPPCGQPLLQPLAKGELVRVDVRPEPEAFQLLA